MRRFSSQFVITNSGPVLKRAIITTEDDGRIVSVTDTGGNLVEEHSVEFHNGIIIPGFVNCHCHLELSHMKNIIAGGEGLGRFIEHIRTSRNSDAADTYTTAFSADNSMFRNGISLCADICNTPDTFGIKKESSIRYINLIEVFGIDPSKARKRMDEVIDLERRSSRMNLPGYLVPHSAYSVSLPLFRLLKDASKGNKVTSMHFMETTAEKEFLQHHSGLLMESYERSGLLPSGGLEMARDHEEAVLNEITGSGNLILVHNTFADKAIIEAVGRRDNLYWCLCPGSNLYIEKATPPLRLLLEKGCEIVIGTDSLASNDRLDILAELITLQLNFPELTLLELVRWGTINGARSLGEEHEFGSISPGKKPGLLLLQDADLQNMKLLKDSIVTRLV